MYDSGPSRNGFDPVHLLCDRGAKPWWEPFVGERSRSGAFGIVLFMVAAPLLVVTTGRDGRFRFSLADIACLMALLGVLLSFQQHLAQGSTEGFLLPMTIACGVAAGVVVSLIRGQGIWMSVGASLAIWFVVAADLAGMFAR